MSDGGGTAAHSRAFENLTGGNPDDIVGLLAYAIYKRAIRENIRAGNAAAPGAGRNPLTTEVEAFRSQAERALERFAEKTVEQARPGIEERAIIGDVRARADELRALIEARTTWWSAFSVNVAASFFMIVLTIVIVVSVKAPTILQWLGIG